MNIRPSNAIRLIENGVIATALFAGSTVARGTTRVVRRAKRFGHEVSVEVKARRMAAELEEVRAMNDKLHAMSPAQRAAFTVDQIKIVQRAAELARGRA